MAFILELIFEVFGELILQLVFEALSQAGVHLFSRSSRREPVTPWLAVVGYVLLGFISAALSLWWFPSFFIPSHVGRLVSLVVTPVLVAGAMALLGSWRHRRGQRAVRLDKFTYAYVFAFAMAATRFFFANAG